LPATQRFTDYIELHRRSEHNLAHRCWRGRRVVQARRAIKPAAAGAGCRRQVSYSGEVYLDLQDFSNYGIRDLTFDPQEEVCPIEHRSMAAPPPKPWVLKSI